MPYEGLIHLPAASGEVVHRGLPCIDGNQYAQHLEAEDSWRMKWSEEGVRLLELRRRGTNDVERDAEM